MINFKFYILVLSFAFLIFNFLGCASVKEMGKGIAGVSTNAVEKSRASAKAKTFNYDYFTCYTKTLDILKNIGSYIYAQDIDKHMIAFYLSPEDTTEVGIFFKETGAASTQVEVSSPSTYAKERIANTLFTALEK